MNIEGLSSHKRKREVKFSKQDLILFEEKIADLYQNKAVNGPIHLSEGNEDILIEIFSYIDKKDWVFSAWRNHYHALLHGVDPLFLKEEICAGRSMGIMSESPKFFSSSIVAGIIPIALGAAAALKIQNKSEWVWCFIGDMTAETGVFWEAYKFSKNKNLPLQFVIEDNNKSVTTPTDETWGKKMNYLPGTIRYQFESKYPHHGTGKWVNF